MPSHSNKVFQLPKNNDLKLPPEVIKIIVHYLDPTEDTHTLFNLACHHYFGEVNAYCINFKSLSIEDREKVLSPYLL